MPAAYSPDAFKTLTPEQQAKEKKKAGCCASFCCCLLVVLIILALSGGAAALAVSECANDGGCPVLKAKPDYVQTTNAATYAGVGVTAIDVHVTRGSLKVQQGTTADSSAEVLSETYDQTPVESEYIKNKFTVDDDDVWTSTYEKSGTGTNDCFYCRKSVVDLTVGTDVMGVTLSSFSGVVEVGALSAEELEIASTFGDIKVTGVIDVVGDVFIATNTGVLTIAEQVSGNNVEIYGGAGALVEVENTISEVVTGSNTTITTATGRSKTTVSGKVVGTTDLALSAGITSVLNINAGAEGGDVVVSGAGTVNVNTISSSSLLIDSTTSGEYGITEIPAGSNGNIEVVGKPSSTIKLGYKCDAASSLEVVVTYISAAEVKYLVDDVAQDPTSLTNSTVTTGGIDVTEFVGKYEGCVGGVVVKTMLVDLTLAVDGYFEVNEIA